MTVGSIGSSCEKQLKYKLLIQIPALLFKLCYFKQIASVSSNGMKRMILSTSCNRDKKIFLVNVHKVLRTELVYRKQCMVTVIISFFPVLITSSPNNNQFQF